MKVFGYFVLALLVASPALALDDNQFKKEAEIYAGLEEKFCWKSTYGRGVGLIPTSCGGNQYDAGLCYPYCKTNFYGVGPVCWQQCPAGWENHPASCYKDIITWYFKESYGRGVGTVPTDCAGKQYDAGLCYPYCSEGYYGVGPVCWRSCGGDTPTDCGAACATNAGTCVKKIFNMIETVFTMIKNIVEMVVTAGGSAAISGTVKKTYEASIKIAKDFMKNGLSKASFIDFMKKKGFNIGKKVVDGTLAAIFDNADKPLDQALAVLEKFDPIGLVDVIRAFTFDIC